MLVVEGVDIEEAVEGGVGVVEVGEVVVEDADFLGESLGAGEDVVEVELLEVLLLLLQVAAVLVDVLVYYLDRLVLYHLLQLPLQPLHPLHYRPLPLHQLPLALVLVYPSLNCLQPPLQTQQLLGNGQVQQVVLQLLPLLLEHLRNPHLFPRLPPLQVQLLDSLSNLSESLFDIADVGVVLVSGWGGGLVGRCLGLCLADVVLALPAYHLNMRSICG